MLSGQRQHREEDQAECRLLPLSYDQHVVPALPMEDGFGGTLDGIWCAQPATGCVCQAGRWLLERGAQQPILANIRRCVAFEDDRSPIGKVMLHRELLHFIETGVALVVSQPD